MKIAFVYNDYNDVRGISTVMQVAERYAMNLNKGEFWVNASNNPSIGFSDGSIVSVLPVSKGLSSLKEYDKVYIDETVFTFVDTTNFSNKIEVYNKNSFKN